MTSILVPVEAKGRPLSSYRPTPCSHPGCDGFARIDGYCYRHAGEVAGATSQESEMDQKDTMAVPIEQFREVVGRAANLKEAAEELGVTTGAVAYRCQYHGILTPHQRSMEALAAQQAAARGEPGPEGAPGEQSEQQKQPAAPSSTVGRLWDPDAGQVQQVLQVARTMVEAARKLHVAPSTLRGYCLRHGLCLPQPRKTPIPMQRFMAVVAAAGSVKEVADQLGLDAKSVSQRCRKNRIPLPGAADAQGTRKRVKPPPQRVSDPTATALVAPSTHRVSRPGPTP